MRREPRWFFNVTRIVGCVDKERSEKLEVGGITLEAFDESKAPSDAALFKHLLTAPLRIYVNDPAKEAVERIVADAGLTGIEFASAAAPNRPGDLLRAMARLR